jgi:uncharacterized cupredoxin-like copper-binding protein
VSFVWAEKEEQVMRTLRKAIGLAAVVAVIAGCGGSGEDVDVSLFEWGVDPEPTSVSAGDVTFNVTNEGGESHEMVIIKDVAPDDLPLDEDGAVIEDDLPEGSFIGEIEELEPGSTESGTFTLEEGTYTILCNITEEEDDGEIESHFQEGMVTTIEVTG